VTFLNSISPLIGVVSLGPFYSSSICSSSFSKSSSNIHWPEFKELPISPMNVFFYPIAIPVNITANSEVNISSMVIPISR